MSGRFSLRGLPKVAAVALLISAAVAAHAQQPAAADPDRWEATIKKFENRTAAARRPVFFDGRCTTT
jgi:hypothetical protein